jgi:hypothetical protein
MESILQKPAHVAAAHSKRTGRLLAVVRGSKLELYMKRPVPVESASALIDEKIKELGDWRGKTLAKVREIIHEVDPEILEEWKWMGTPVWSHGGIVCTGETYKKAVKMTFANGAALKDPSGLFNSSLDGNVRRAIDIHEGDKVNEAALKDLIRAAVALNVLRKPRKTAAVSIAPRKEQRVPLPASGRASASFSLKRKSKPKPRRASSKRAD